MRRATLSMNAAEGWCEIGVECGQAPRKHVPGGRGALKALSGIPITVNMKVAGGV